MKKPLTITVVFIVLLTLGWWFFGQDKQSSTGLEQNAEQANATDEPDSELVDLAKDPTRSHTDLPKPEADPDDALPDEPLTANSELPPRDRVVIQVIDQASGAPVAKALAEGNEPSMFLGDTSSESLKDLGPPSGPDGLISLFLQEDLSQLTAQQLLSAKFRQERRRNRQLRREVMVSAPGMSPVAITLTEANIPPGEPKVVTLSPGAALQGQITIEPGLPHTYQELSVTVEARLVAVSQPQDSLKFGGTVTWSSPVNPDGTFELKDLPPSIRLKAHIRKGGKSLWQTPEPMRLIGGQVKNVDWTLSSGAEVTVQAMASGGGPAANLNLVLDRAPQKGIVYQRALTEIARKTTTDSVGRASFESVGPGNWCVTISEKQQDSELAPPAPAIHRFEVLPGQKQIQIDLDVYRGLYISGKLYSSNGEPCKKGSVGASGMDGGSLNARTDLEGAFKVGPLLPGQYLLRSGSMGDKMDTLAIPVSAQAGDENVEIRLRLGGRAIGTVVDKATKTRLAAQVGYRPIGEKRGAYTAHIDDGIFDIGGLIAGTCNIVVETSDGRIAVVQGLQIVAGETLEDLEIAVPAATHIEVHYQGSAERIYVSTYSNGARLNFNWVYPNIPKRIPTSPGQITLETKVRKEDKSWQVTGTQTVQVAIGTVQRVDLTD